MTKYIYHSEKTKTTCKECLQHDGKTFYTAKDLPQLPIHPNCKCYIETIENNSDHDQCDCGDRTEILNTNLLNILENSNSMQKSIKSELLECAIALETNPNSKDFQTLQENFITMQDKISALIKSTKDLSTDIGILKEFSYDNTYHTKGMCKMTDGLNNYSKQTTSLCKQLNYLAEDIKALKEKRKTLSKEAEKSAKEEAREVTKEETKEMKELKELKKGTLTGAASGVDNIPLPEDSEIEIIVKDNAQNNTKNKAELLGKISVNENSKEDSFGTSAPFKLHIEYNEASDKNIGGNTDKSSVSNQNLNTMNNSKIQDAGFNSVIGLVHVTEGGFVDDPNDMGGRTNRGITQRTYNAYNKKHGLPIKDVKYITKEEADTIYYKEYWLASGANKIKDPNLAYMHFDAAINHGVCQANKFLNQSGGDFDKYYDLRKNLYTNLAKRPKQQRFYNGWINRINRIDKIRKENILKTR